MTLYHGDCMDVLPMLETDSVDAVVTDPPYHLTSGNAVYDLATTSAGNARESRKTRGGGFMGKGWDGGDIAHQSTLWREVLRVLKPGGHLVAFGGTRTYHRLACAIEDAGFEVRDTLVYLYGSGFPKSLDVSKAIDKGAGAQREIVADGLPFGKGSMRNRSRVELGYRPTELNPDGGIAQITAPATPEAEQWHGWGTALKPAMEPIVLARKPLRERTVAGNVLRYGTGAINVDGCRIGNGSDVPAFTYNGGDGNGIYADGLQASNRTGAATHRGRWPANVLLSHSPGCTEVGTRKVRGSGFEKGRPPRTSGTVYGAHRETDFASRADPDGTETIPAWDCDPTCAVRLLDEQSGERPSGGGNKHVSGNHFTGVTRFTVGAGNGDGIGGDTGGASRFFYTAKAASAERSSGMGARNTHPTVKPLDLMGWLCKLVCPPGGTILDPFLGSGSTAIAAIGNGFGWVGIEKEDEYIAVAEQRIGLGCRAIRHPLADPA